jgi:hypothetical protein
VGADEQQLTDLRQLQALLVYPREGLDVEIKGWLDLDDGEQAAALVKAILALANHGGGYVLIGFAEVEGVWAPDERNRPPDLRQYDQDRLNGLVTRYAEPSFHCELHHVPHPETQSLYPVVVVPPSRVPVRAKRDSPEARHVRKDSYYIRRPGPKSETPQTGQEWADFLRRCTLGDREHLLDDIRRLLQGGFLLPSTPAPTVEEQLEEWVASSLERWRSLVAEREAEDRYRHGVVTYTYVLEGEFTRPSPQEMLSILEEVKGRETGWPMWVVFRGRDELAPRPANGTIESIFVDTVFEDPSHSDYWRASPDGLMFLLRGYEEDGEPQQRLPGTALDFTIPVWRFGEALRHSERLARALGDPEATIHFRASWSGLEGRRLRALWSRRILGGEYVARQDSVVSYISSRADLVSPTLSELLQRLLAPLYASFDFFEMPPAVIDEELSRMLERA